MAPRALTTPGFLETSTFEGLEILTTPPRHDRALLYFHGFPGPYTTSSASELRVADQLFPEIFPHFDFYYPLYSRKAAGTFSFEQTIDDGRKAFRFLRSRQSYRSVTLVGQSWGAVIALALARDASFERVILITPFVALPTGASALKTAQHYSAKHPDLLAPERVPEIVAQIERLAKDQSPAEALAKLRSEKIVFAASADEVIPLKAIQHILNATGPARLHVIEGSTHELEDREELVRIFRDELLR